MVVQKNMIRAVSLRSVITGLMLPVCFFNWFLCNSGMADPYSSQDLNGGDGYPAASKAMRVDTAVVWIFSLLQFAIFTFQIQGWTPKDTLWDKDVSPSLPALVTMMAGATHSHSKFQAVACWLSWQQKRKKQKKVSSNFLRMPTFRLGSQVGAEERVSKHKQLFHSITVRILCFQVYAIRLSKCESRRSARGCHSTNWLRRKGCSQIPQ